MTFDKKKYDQKYVKNNYDRIPLNVKKGEKEKIAQHAKNKGFDSITEYIKDLIYKDMNSKNSNIKVGNIKQNGNNNSININ